MVGDSSYFSPPYFCAVLFRFITLFLHLVPNFCWSLRVTHATSQIPLCFQPGAAPMEAVRIHQSPNVAPASLHLQRRNITICLPRVGQGQSAADCDWVPRRGTILICITHLPLPVIALSFCRSLFPSWCSLTRPFSKRSSGSGGFAGRRLQQCS